MKRRVLMLLVMGVLGVLFLAPGTVAGAQDACYPPGNCTTAPSVGPSSTAPSTTAAPSGEQLARTGSDSSMPLSTIAAILIAGGGLFVIVARKQRSSRVSA